MGTSSDAKLLSEIERYLVAADMHASTFGLLALNDGKLVMRLRAGSSVTLRTADKIRAWMAENRPRRRRLASAAA